MDLQKHDVRINDLPDGQSWVFSDTLGLLRSRTGQYCLTAASKAYPRVLRLVNRWMKDSWSECSEQLFCSTSISINSAYAAKLHRDRSNQGPSICKAVGHFTGGRLGYFSEDDRSFDLLTLKQNMSMQQYFVVYNHASKCWMAIVDIGLRSLRVNA